MKDDPTGGFGERFALETFAAGDGVLLDLQSGSYFRLNATAIAVCEALRAEPRLDEAIERVASRLEIPRVEATRAVTSVASGLERGATPETPPGPFRYEARPDGSGALSEDGRPILAVDPQQRTVKLEAPLTALTAPLALYLRSLMPKLLALLEVPVLHAAACRIEGRLVAFSGKSGAGKTTTARAFAKAGAELVSEDLLVLDVAGDSVGIHVEGEPFARAWAQSSAGALQAAPEGTVSFQPLAGAPRGPMSRLDALWLVDAGRRANANFQLRALTTGDAVSTMLGNGILASTSPAQWRDFLRQVRWIAERTSPEEATLPDGLEPLSRAAERYIVKTAS
jgi:hypothetical protein